MQEKIQSCAVKVQRVIFITAISFMLVALVANVFMRYVFGRPIIWTEEVTSLMQGGIAFLGIGYCFARKKHIELTLVYDKLPFRAQAFLDVLTHGLMLYCLYELIGVSMTIVSRQMIPLGTVTWLKIGYFYAMIPLGFIVAAIYVLAGLGGALRRLTAGPAAQSTGSEV